MNIPRQEYPRPQLRRTDETYTNLNGTWELEFDPAVSGHESDMRNLRPYSGQITVPYVIESKLSGVEHIDFMPSLWYRRYFKAPRFDPERDRLLLHFGAVDYRCEAWLNDVKIGSHFGGYTPFAFDITETVKDADNELVVWVRSNVRDPMQPSGKQSERYYNFGCMYTRCTGIWQTVWIERVPRSYIKNLKMTPDVDRECLDVEVRMAGDDFCGSLSAEAAYKGEYVSGVTVRANAPVVRFSIPIKNPRLWNPGAPEIYDMTISVGNDRVETYFGMRKVAVKGRFIEINDKPVFMRLVLDQGYYPDGIYTAPNEEALKHDIELSMKAGFNGARLHMKIFEPRFIYYADIMGYILWGEYPNWGIDNSKPEALASVVPEWMEEMERDYNSPAIIGWCPLNETCHMRNEQLHTIPYEITKAIDPMRPVIDTSGYFHTDKYDVFDVHDYCQDVEEFAGHYAPLATGEGEVYQNPGQAVRWDGRRPYFVSEYGGIKWEAQSADGAWGYGSAPENEEEFYNRLEGLTDVLLNTPGICGFCYTQLTDVYQETNGIYNFDRTEKLDMERIHGIFSKKAAVEK